ncbi:MULTISPECIES: phenylacetate--CoA ligase family protein [unclassified Brevibacterium]|uniref:phenylacetate--CoA ligase family protein n=1 Tax=unclassified Brevibacterium TaxID=2614124 RepID=UPI001E61E7C2|nr:MULTISPECIES: phenylacetate--CoA ligase family protein [unclassified Brevibacterium]MCD1286934.1 CoF synthetase [Brevibacterium sp. CCUG 69071]MDK8436161.1 phenylacetate--CoA ligase family protein [Brevibacterium sp. H-BE7]
MSTDQPPESSALRRLPIPRGPVNLARQTVLRLANLGLTTAYGAYRLHPAIWRFTAKHYHPGLEPFAKLNAWMICQQASLDVPAYQDYLARTGFTFRWWDLESYTPTSKDEFVRRYSEEHRCWGGRIDRVGTVVDESSGSSGTPFNWMRSKRELGTVHKNVAGYVTMLFDQQDLFAINAFSMGAWATGTNTGLAMAKVAMVKNTGPDLEKILDTMRHFGPGHSYLISAYPPFLKHLVDRMDSEPGVWDDYRLNGFVGGEAMTEGLRDYVEQRFDRVYSGYGASDLTIGMAGESDLSVVIRRALATDLDFRAEVLGPEESRVPMVFQYNPLETFLETTDEGELVATINSASVMSPRLRYNIGDEAMLIDFPRMVELTRAHPELARACSQAFAGNGMKLPFVLLFGRADSTISYMGANIYPLDIENGLYRDNPQAHLIESFRIELLEGEAHEQRPALHIQMREEAPELSDADRSELAGTIRRGVLDHLASVSRDFAQSMEEDPSTAEIHIEIHDHATGPFAEATTKIKNVYVQKSRVKESIHEIE